MATESGAIPPCCKPRTSRYSPVPPLLTATLLPFRSARVLIGELFGTTIDSLLAVMGWYAKIDMGTPAAIEVTNDVELPLVRSTAFAFNASNAGAAAGNGPAQTTFTPCAASALSSEPLALASVRSEVPLRYAIRSVTVGWPAG